MKQDDAEGAKRLMRALVNMKPKPHEDMKKRKRPKSKKSPSTASSAKPKSA
jgi:hypothetical protein